MENNQQTGLTGAAKGKNPFKIATIVLAIVVLGLGGLSTWALIDNANKSKSIANSQTNNETSDDEAEKIVEVPDNQTPDTPSETPSLTAQSGPYIADGYFVVPHWGQKFRLSDELTDYGYSVQQDCIGCSYGKYNVGLTAVFKSDLQNNPQARYYATIDFCSIITVSKTTQSMANVSGPKKIIPFDGSSFVVYDFNAHGGCADQGFGLMTTSYYDKVANKLTEIMSNPENI